MCVLGCFSDPSKVCVLGGKSVCFGREMSQRGVLRGYAKRCVLGCFLWYLGCFERALKMSRFGRVLRVVCAYLTKTEKIEPAIKM